MHQDPVVIVSAARTPMGAFQGDFSDLAAHDLGGAAIKAAVERAGIKPERALLNGGKSTGCHKARNFARPQGKALRLPLGLLLGKTSAAVRYKLLAQGLER